MNGDDLKKILNLLKPFVNNLSHAYLFATDVDYDYEIITKEFVSMIREKYNKTEKNDISDLIIVKPEGMWIKKEQLIELKSEFSTKSLNSSKRIYIINNVDKLNPSSANTLLKFLEEPENDIVAILTTSNINNVFETIISRCQIINLQYISKNTEKPNLYSFFKEYISNEEYIKDDYGPTFINKSIDFLMKYENYKTKAICFSKKNFHTIFLKREEIEISLQIMVMFYRDVLRYIYNKEPIYFDNQEENIKNIAKTNNYVNIINKINILNQKKELVKYNVNINMLIDSLIFDFEGV